MIYTAASAAGEGREGGECDIHCCIRGWRGGERGGASMIYTAASAAGEGERGGEYDIHCCIRGWRGGERGRRV